ncbi:MAG: hypothetical protein ABI543_03535 [Ignavibacteria bacterium]
MVKTYLVELLSKLSSKQMRELSDFVKSPFFNKNESAEKLFEYLRVNHPDSKPEKIEKEFIYHKLFSPAEYNDSFMRMIIFKLTELTEQYLAYSDMKQQDNAENIHLINSLLELGLDKGAQRTINNSEKELTAGKLFNGSHYENRYKLEKFKHIIYSRSYQPITVKDKPDETLLEESNNLTSYFIISILQRYRYLLNKSFSVNSSFKLEFLPYILNFLESEGKKYLEIKLIMILYKQILLLLDNSREDLFYELKNYLTDDDIPLETSERRDGITVLVNLCIEKGYSGKGEFYKLMFELDQYLVARNMYNRVPGGYFDAEMFMNLVTIGLKLDETEWTKRFIEDNYKKLSPDSSENLYNYTYSKLYFKSREFEKAHQYIAKVSYTDLHMKINARITSIMIQYELGNIEEVLMQTENYRKYIQKDKLLNSSHRKITSNFIKYASAICKARYSSRVNLKEMKEEIEKCDMISNRSWLLEKTEELKQRKG